LGAVIQGLSFPLSTTTGAALGNWSLGSIAILLGLMLLVGFLTPVAGIAATVGYVAVGASLLQSLDPVKHNNAFTALDLSFVSAALVFLGPGAFSVDARMFGRREIVIPRADVHLDDD